MYKGFKKYFIPHESNNHKPYVLRWEAVLVILSFILLVEIYFLVQAFWFIPQGNFFASIVPITIENLTNKSRLDNNLELLKVNSLLEKAAQLKAENMATKGYFAHTSPDEGLTPWYWLDNVGYKYVVAGENLAVNFVDSQDAINAWMNSPIHRDNILNNNFHEIGVGTAKGIYEGKETTFIVQFFGRRSVITAESAIVVNEDKQPIPSIAGSSNESFTENPTITTVKGEVRNVVASDNPSPTELAVKENPTLSIANRLLSTPRAVSNYLYFVLFTILLLALLLSIFIKIRIQHKALIINGVILLLIISSIIWLNQYIALTQTKII